MKRKVEDSTVFTSVRANEIIDLVFLEDSLTSSYLTNPTFTHQLFDQENITNLSHPHESRIKIFISCFDLSSYVEFNSHIKANEQIILEKLLERGLPSGFEKVTSSTHALKKIVISDSIPPGKCLHTFEIDGETFEIWLTKYTDDGSAKILSRAEKVAIWFIETADSIDFSDERWEVLMIYHVKKPPNEDTKYYYFGGYYTLFTFRNPFSGGKLRICQALILPHLQGKGIGREMLMTVYRIAEEREDIAEITVEDPAISFQRLRDKVDFQWARLKMQSMKDLLNHSTKEFVATISKTLKLCHTQSVFVNESIKLHAIILHIKGNDKNSVVDEMQLNDSEDFRRFRLDVKRRILQENPDLKAFNKERKLKILEEMFEAELKRYSNVVYKQ